MGNPYPLKNILAVSFAHKANKLCIALCHLNMINLINMKHTPEPLPPPLSPHPLAFRSVLPWSLFELCVAVEEVVVVLVHGEQV